MGTPATLRHTVLLMGVAGCGKSTIGTMLAQNTAAIYLDADRLHPPGNIAKMAASTPLTDADREQWLCEVAKRITTLRQAGTPAIIGCSALKKAYRDLLRTADPDLLVVHLRGSRSQLADRLARRHGHFFPPSLLDAQLSDLEAPTVDERAITVSIGQTPAAMVGRIMLALTG